MGADFLLIAVRNDHLSQEELDARIDALDDTRLAEARYEKNGEMAPTDEEVQSNTWEPLGYDENDWRNDVRLYLKECTAEMFFNDKRRDVQQLNLDGNDWIFAGGMSWGDDPSDGFRMLSALAAAGF